MHVLGYSLWQKIWNVLQYNTVNVRDQLILFFVLAEDLLCPYYAVQIVVSAN